MVEFRRSVRARKQNVVAAGQDVGRQIRIRSQIHQDGEIGKVGAAAYLRVVEGDLFAVAPACAVPGERCARGLQLCEIEWYVERVGAILLGSGGGGFENPVAALAGEIRGGKDGCSGELGQAIDQ